VCGSATPCRRSTDRLRRLEKTTPVQTLNNNVRPTFEAEEAVIEVVLSDNGREFCGREDRHPYKLFLQLEGIEHLKTRVKRPQSNGIVERLHRTLLDEHVPAVRR
jgi:transposase InsO family protein